MQLSLPLRSQALGRCVGLAGRCILHLPYATTTTITRAFNSDHKPEDDKFDPIILKFQQILVRSASKNKHPLAKAKGKGKGLGNHKKGPYQPFTRTKDIEACDETVEKSEIECFHSDSLRRESEGNGRILNASESERKVIDSEWREVEGKWGVQRKIPPVTSMSEREEGEVEVKEREKEGRNIIDKDRREEENYKTEEERMKERREMKQGREGKEERKKERREMEERREEEKEDRTEEERMNERKKMKEGREGKEEERMKERRETEEEREGIKEEEGIMKEEVISERVGVLISEILSEVEKCDQTELLDECLRQNTVPSFDLLRRLCAATSKTSLAGVIRKIQALISYLYPSLYLQHYGLDYYLASSLCRGGKVEESLSVLLHLHHQIHPHFDKKTSDITQLVLYRIVEEADEGQVELAVRFVNGVVKKLSLYGPAVSLWSALFTSCLYRMQKVSERLVERHPKLIHSIARRMEGLVDRASWSGDHELLQRLLHFLLHHEMSNHYRIATSALLQLQCDMGDLRAAEETIKFSQKLNIRVTPSALHRFLALLNHHRRPVPLALLALKYRPPLARRPITPPPSHKYKF